MKRFRIIFNRNQDMYIEDVITHKQYSLDYLLCDLLNDLDEESRMLRKEVEDLKFALRTEQAYNRVANDSSSYVSVYGFLDMLEKW